MADTQTKPEVLEQMPQPEPQGNHLTTRQANGNLPGVEEMSTRVITAVRCEFPRNEAMILSKLKVRAAAAGADWYYRFPVKDKGATKYIEGPSIKCANNVAQLFGNCAVRTRAIDNFDSWIIYARLEDYETGFVYERPWLQPKGQSTFKSRDQDRLEAIAFQIGTSKAIRNVICNALQLFTDYAFEEARNSLVERIGKDLPKARKSLLTALQGMNVDVKRVEATVGRLANDWLAPDCARINAEIQAVADGMATADETWPSGERPTRESVKAEQAKKKDTAGPISAVAPADNRANQAAMPERSADSDIGSNGGKPAPTKIDMYGEDGNEIGTHDNEKAWAVAFIKFCTESPSIARALCQTNEPLFSAIETALDADDEIALLKDFRAVIEQAGRVEEQQQPEPPAEELKPIAMPKMKGTDAIDISAYVKQINTEIGLAPDEAMVRRIWSREKPNMALIKPAYRAAIHLRAAQQLGKLGVQNPNFDD